MFVFAAGVLTVCRVRSFAVFSAEPEAEADALEAVADFSGISDFFRRVSPLVGIALVTIGVTGLATWEEDSLSEELISICLLPFTSRFLFSLRVSERTSLLIPCLKRSAILTNFVDSIVFSCSGRTSGPVIRCWSISEAWPRYRRVRS